MNRLIYTAMTGAKHVFMQQAGVANNLANVNTIGFKAQMHRFEAVPVLSEAMPTRAFVADSSIQEVFDEGPILRTDNPLDIALNGPGWLAVQTADGEAYTRAGALEVNVNGVLQTKSGYILEGDGGPITIPPDNHIAIGGDGTVSVIPTFGNPNVVNVVGRLKLVNPPESDLVRGDDGMFRLKGGGGIAPMDESISVSSGNLEGSNVNPAETMVQLISLSRQFEMQIKLLQTADQSSQAADKLLTYGT